MEVHYSKLLKPLERDCKRYCAEYPCNKKECSMRKLIKGNRIVMGDKFICDKLDSNMKWKNWNNQGECIFNNDAFTRRKLA